MKKRTVYEEILDKAYKNYVYYWLICNDYSLDDVFQNVSDYAEDLCDVSIYESFLEWKENQGFSGQIFACKGEFEDCEFQDIEFMSKMLSHEDYLKYLSLKILKNNEKLNRA